MFEFHWKPVPRVVMVVVDCLLPNSRQSMWRVELANCIAARTHFAKWDLNSGLDFDVECWSGIEWFDRVLDFVLSGLVHP